MNFHLNPFLGETVFSSFGLFCLFKKLEWSTHKERSSSKIGINLLFNGLTISLGVILPTQNSITSLSPPTVFFCCCVNCESSVANWSKKVASGDEANVKRVFRADNSKNDALIIKSSIKCTQSC